MVRYPRESVYDKSPSDLIHKECVVTAANYIVLGLVYTIKLGQRKLACIDLVVRVYTQLCLPLT